MRAAAALVSACFPGFTGALPSRWCRVDEEDFAKTLLEDPEKIIELTSLVDIRKATAFNPADIELIFGMIREMPGDGFVSINATMKGQVSGLVMDVCCCALGARAVCLGTAGGIGTPIVMRLSPA